jgi:3-methyl-2-oxobutanoate hydroxymethyltransferase
MRAQPASRPARCAQANAPCVRPRQGQFIFAEDLVGSNSGHIPRHAITYARIYETARQALAQYRADVLSGAYPAAKHAIKIKDDEFAKFLQSIS